jgi:hypothetical protein
MGGVPILHACVYYVLCRYTYTFASKKYVNLVRKRQKKTLKHTMLEKL